MKLFRDDKTNNSKETWVINVAPHKTLPAARSEEKWLFSQANFPLQISYTKKLEISAKALPCLNDFLAYVSKLSRTKSFSKIQQVTTESITNEG